MDNNQTIFDKIINDIENSLDGKKGPSATYVIGDNGTGKSRLLASICEYYDDDCPDNVTSVLCITNSTNDKFIYGDGKKRKYLGPRNVGNAIFQSLLSREIAKLIVKAIIKNKKQLNTLLPEILGIEFILEFQKTKDKKTLHTKLDDTIDKRKIKNTTTNQLLDAERRKWLAEAIAGSINMRTITVKNAEHLDAYLELNPNVDLIIKKQKSHLNFNLLSSGEKNRIATTVKLIAHAENNCIVLIDEPEISLHLKWQMDFHSSLIEVMGKYKNYHIVIATHSPVIVSEAVADKNSEAIFVMQSDMHQAGSGDEPSESKNYRVARPGDIESCEKLTLNLFNIVTYNSTAPDLRITEAVLDAAESQGKVNESINLLNDLLIKDGLPSDKKFMINEAIDLIKHHLPARSAPTLINTDNSHE